jgi:O-antigen/teichoic acid export membrane protein
MVSTAKNTAYLLLAYIYQKLIALFYFILLARFLGADNFGKYTFALSFAALFSVLIDFGLFQVLTREVARDQTKTKEYFGNILGFCLLSGLGVLGLIALIINLLNYPLITKQVVYCTGLVILLDTLALCFYYTLRGHLNTKYEAWGIVLHKSAMLLTGLFLMAQGASLILMILPLFLGSVFYLGSAVLFLKKKLNLWPIPYFNKNILKKLLKIAWPFFLAAVFAKLYSTSDTILLSYLSGDKAVGWYSASLKLVNAFLLLIAGSLSSALYPSLSYYFVHAKEKLNVVFTQSVFYLIFLTIPLAFAFIILSEPIIFFIYGAEYAPAVLILILLSLAIPFMFLDFIMVALLNACEKQKINTLIHGLGVGIFIILNLILIPRFDYLGAALAVILGFLVIFILEIISAKGIVRIKKSHLFKKIGLTLLASLTMGIVLFLIKERVHIGFSVLTGFSVYFVFAYLFNLINQKDFLFLKDLFRLRI